MDLKNKKLVRTVQIVLGLFLVFTVLSGFFQFFPAPQFNETGAAFLAALFSTGYILTLMTIIFLITGLMFVFNKWSAFGTLLLAPITVNIVLFHIFLDFTGWYSAFILMILNIYLGVIYWSRYKPIFSK